MIKRALLLGEGTSDSGIVPHIESIAARRCIDLRVTDPDLSRLPKPPGRAITEKLRAAMKLSRAYELIVVHRDADGDGHQSRVQEVANAIDQVVPEIGHVAVVPVRMTEAWLLTSEPQIRQVAGNPSGRMALQLPKPNQVERVRDPKARLQQILADASGLHGRKLEKFRARFPQQRRQLLERLDPDGGVSKIPSWTRFVSDLGHALDNLR